VSVLPITTDRLVLRGFEPADAPAILAVYGDPEVMRHVGEGHAVDLAGAETMLAEYIEHQRRHGYSFWAVVERASGALIGDAGLYSADAEVELGYTLGRAWWGRGYATEAAQACLDAAFGELGLRSVIAVADPANPASARVLEKLGFAEEPPRIAYGRMHRTFRARGRPSA
jgi:[ribosomal protein S5]-alanine N-acetyltransferase